MSIQVTDDYHDFKERLALANANTRLEQLQVFYRSVFPGVESVTKIADVEKQRQGIDTVVTLCNGKKIYFDEKYREEDYGDILLEEYSVWRGYPFIGNREFGPRDSVPPMLAQHLVPGWLVGEKMTDYIIYIVGPSGVVYLLPFLLLQRAWRLNYFNWLAKYGRVASRNKGYHTTNIPVPVSVLFDSLYDTAQW